MELNIISRDSKRELTSHWDYDKSVKKMNRLILKWKNISTEILDELYTAQKVLSSQGARNDLTYENKGWEHYLNDIGLAKTTVIRWLKQYDPETGEIISSSDSVVESVLLPKEIEGTVNTPVPTNHSCPHCGYKW